MGETKEVQLHGGLRVGRIVTATLAGLFFFIVLVQIAFFPNVEICFYTGADAQQLAAINIKKGEDVELPTPLKPGACFMGWSLSPSSTEVIKDSTGILKNTTLYAVWDGAEKYAVLTVNGIFYKEVNIFDTRVDGLTVEQLNQEWRVLDDYSADNKNRIKYNNQIMYDPNNNFTRFLGWQYLNNHGVYNDLLYQPDSTGASGTWTLVERDSDGNEKVSQISDVQKFYPPNYRTTFTALLEYRKMHIRFLHEEDGNNYNSVSGKFGEEVVMPVYNNPDNPTAKFSHWGVETGNLIKYVTSNATYNSSELSALVDEVQTRYESGEVVTSINPLLYYLGDKLQQYNASTNELVTIINVRAIDWGDNGINQFSVRAFTDVSSGTEYHDFSDVSYDELSLDTPVSYDAGVIWFFYDPQILSYTFYDHNGVYHEIKSANLNGFNRGFVVGDETNFLGKKVYFNANRAITISVNYQSAAKNINVKFNYGADIYSLPNYVHYENPVIVSSVRKIGNSFILLTGENYMKTDHIFTGWRLVGDDSGRIYRAGEWYTIPNFKTSEGNITFEFEAVWYLQRLLFDFDFNGGNWEVGKEPDFTLMKGAYGSLVRIVPDIPVRFGYDFVGWALDKNTNVSESDILQPNEVITVGTKFQTLYAQWKPRRLRVLFYTKNNNGDWILAKDPVVTNDYGQSLSSGDVIQLPFISDTKWYHFNGWQIGNNINPGNTDVCLSTDILSRLETATVKDVDTGIYLLQVKLYANVSKLTTNIDYELEVDIDGAQKILINNIETSRLPAVLPHGERFYDYYPFSVAAVEGDYSIFDTAGRGFISWHYTVDKINYIPIEPNTTVPVGTNKMFISGTVGKVKTIKIEYYDFSGQAEIIDSTSYIYSSPVSLLKEGDIDFSLLDYYEDWGTFVGWSVEQDDVSGNPQIVYNTKYRQNPILELSSVDDVSTDPYKINIDNYAEKLNDNEYVLKLYAVYASDFATVSYDLGNNQKNELRFPVYINGDYTKTVLGGSTVGYDSVDFLAYGNTVLDDYGSGAANFENFVGWQAVLPIGVNPVTRNYFENKIWFPGEYLPSIDFNIDFKPIYCVHSDAVQEIEVGTTTYRVLSVRSQKVVNGKLLQINNSSNVDIVALPQGKYTVTEGSIKITSNREVHVIVPVNNDSEIVLEQRSIQSDSIKEFYVGENLVISGSPVIGANFTAYRVQKGYRIMDEQGNPIEIEGSAKYDYAASMLGLLISKDCKTLYAVPSHVNLTTAELFNLLESKSISCIKGYAFADINSLTSLNLAFDLDDYAEFEIEANAIYNGTMESIVLPYGSISDKVKVSARVLAGTLEKLKFVYFGDYNTSVTNYAFVSDSIVYYVDDPLHETAKTHVMYVLRSVKLTALDFSSHKNNLHFADTVAIIEPCALMGCDWTLINSIRAENEQLDLRNVKGIPANKPVFISLANEYKEEYNNRMFQSYEKKFIFTCHDSVSGSTTKEITYTYGQTFNVFNAQANNVGVYFNKNWRQFAYWKMNGDRYYPGQSYKVGINTDFQGDEFVLDATSAECWVNYPVQFYIYDAATKKNIPYEPTIFHDNEGNKYSLGQLLTYMDYLDEIYLPGVDQTFTTSDGSVYQFIGWSTRQTVPSNFNSMLWNNADKDARILPNHTAQTYLNKGSISFEGSDTVYKYYALYEKVTPKLSYTALDDNTFAVAGLSEVNRSELNIPFAIYSDGYMLPVSKINEGVFNSVRVDLKEIVIGGAVSEIGDFAFSSVKAEKITFAHKGLTINYNPDGSAYNLKIGKNAFAGNTAIKKIVLPASLTNIDDRAFYACTNLTYVTFELDTVSLKSLGDFVFCDNNNMRDNDIVDLLVKDTVQKKRFSRVGNGIFMNTAIANVRDANGNLTNKIVWCGKLLHVYYLSGNTDLNFEENEIAGYAFVNAGTGDASINITLRFTNKDVIINSRAFSNLHKSVNKIYMKKENDKNVYVRSTNVKEDAFDTTIQHIVYVYTSDYRAWSERFRDVASVGYVKFPNSI